MTGSVNDRGATEGATSYAVCGTVAMVSPINARIVSLVLWLVAAGPVQAWAQPASKTLTPEMEPVTLAGDTALNDATAAEVGTLIAQLGAPKYELRESSTDRLIEIGPGAFGELLRAYRAADELEIRLRVERIVHDAYLDYHVYDRHGFLGVGLRVHVPGRDRAAQLPERVAGLTVTNVTEKTGAEKAGIKVKDVIVALDGEPLESAVQETVSAFAESIRSRRPGTSIRLSIFRGTEELTIDAVLGRPPVSRLPQLRIIAIPELVQESNARFRSWWTRHFAGPSSDQVARERP